jgi:transcriptional antiterminator NusG
MSASASAAGSESGGGAAFDWYVLKVSSNREKSIRDNLVRRIRREGLERYFGQIVIPTQKVVDTKGGKRKVTEVKLYPGYLMIEMAINEETWALVRSTSGVGDFTGAGGKPQPMKPEEVARMLGAAESQKQQEAVKVKIGFRPGDTVKIREGSFQSFQGVVESIDESTGKVSVLVEIFNRKTPVENLDYWQVETV